MRKNIGGHVSKTYQRVIFSLLLVMILPVVLFFILFMSYQRQMHQKNIVSHAETELNNSVVELDGYLTGLNDVVLFNSLFFSVQKMGDYQADYICSVLGKEVLSHPVLRDISYYNSEIPDTVFTKVGTYSLKYYAQQCIGMENGQQLLNFMDSLEENVWLSCDMIYPISQKRERTLMYVIKPNEQECWFFKLSEEKLDALLYGDESATTVLLDKWGKQLYPLDEEKVPEDPEEYLKVVVDSSGGDFGLCRSISKEILFREIDQWQTYFVIVFLVVCVLGGILIRILASFNERPINDLQEYCKGKFNDIPSTLGGLEAFEFTLNKFEEQICLLEKRRKINLLILQMIYGKVNEAPEFRSNMEETELFRFAECYRAIVVVYQGEYGSASLKQYMNVAEAAGYEFQIVEISSRNIAVIVVGMKEEADCKLQEYLQLTADTIANNINLTVTFYVGNKCEDIEAIHLSYLRAMACCRSNDEDGVSVHYYKPTKGGGQKFLYPNIELNTLYDALVELDFDKAFMITDVLLDILVEENGNISVVRALYFDILKTFYSVQTKLGIEVETSVLDFELGGALDSAEAASVILHVRNQFRDYFESLKEKKENNNFISRVILYIDENIKIKDLNVSMVADYFDISISNLSKRFKAATNRTISDYIVEKKFVYAGELLKKTEYCVKDVAVLLGYSQANSFIRKFKQYYGVTPQEYRNREQER